MRLNQQMASSGAEKAILVPSLLRSRTNFGDEEEEWEGGGEGRRWGWGGKVIHQRPAS